MFLLSHIYPTFNICCNATLTNYLLPTVQYLYTCHRISKCIQLLIIYSSVVTLYNLSSDKMQVHDVNTLYLDCLSIPFSNARFSKTGRIMGTPAAVGRLGRWEAST